MATELPLHDQLSLAALTHNVQWLLRLDQMWTHWLAMPSLTVDERAMLADVGTDMEQMLATITLKDRLVAVEHAVTVRREAAAATVRTILHDEPGLGGSRVGTAADPSGFADFMHQRLADLALGAPAAVEELAGKAEKLRSGDWAPGDLAPQMVCLLLSFVFGNSVMLAVKDKDTWYGIAVGALKDMANYGCAFLQ